MDTSLQQLFESQGIDSTLSLDIVGFSITMLIAIMFGLILRLLYNLYFRDNEPQDGSLARSLVILTPALTALFWMIQNSIVLSIGLLGSMAFVRFRTPVKRSEDISFVIITLAVAISCAIEKYFIGSILVAVMFVYALARNYFAEHSLQSAQRYAIVTFNTKKTSSVSEIKKVFDNLNLKSEFVSSRTYDGITSYVFNVTKFTKTCHDAVTASLANFDNDAHINIFYPNERLGA